MKIFCWVVLICQLGQGVSDGNNPIRRVGYLGNWGAQIKWNVRVEFDSGNCTGRPVVISNFRLAKGSSFNPHRSCKGATVVGLDIWVNTSSTDIHYFSYHLPRQESNLQVLKHSCHAMQKCIHNSFRRNTSSFRCGKMEITSTKVDLCSESKQKECARYFRGKDNLDWVNYYFYDKNASPGEYLEGDTYTRMDSCVGSRMESVGFSYREAAGFRKPEIPDVVSTIK
mmetsp:Transcript_44033/g.70509  ORF Transcript_44033/g.70509 Transcript_44033/m.70509 type:complete len:226 (-) Transcript_44033:28-705(-)